MTKHNLADRQVPMGGRVRRTVLQKSTHRSPLISPPHSADQCTTLAERSILEMRFVSTEAAHSNSRHPHVSHVVRPRRWLIFPALVYHITQIMEFIQKLLHIRGVWESGLRVTGLTPGDSETIGNRCLIVLHHALLAGPFHCRLRWMIPRRKTVSLVIEALRNLLFCEPTPVILAWCII